MEINWHRTAKDDLSSIYTYIFNENPFAAGSTIGAIVNLIEMQLPLFPLSGRIGRVRDTRELVVPKTSFIVVYSIIGEQIAILAVQHTSRKWPLRFE